MRIVNSECFQVSGVSSPWCFHDLRQNQQILGKRNVVLGRNESFRKMAHAARILFPLLRNAVVPLCAAVERGLLPATVMLPLSVVFTQVFSSPHSDFLHKAFLPLMHLTEFLELFHYHILEGDWHFDKCKDKNTHLSYSIFSSFKPIP